MRGAHVIGTARTKAKAEEAARSVPGKATGLECELADPRSVRACVAAIQEADYRFDAIIANAGIMAPPSLEKAFAYESQFFTNHIGHFLLVTSLLDRLAPDGRVVILSSSAHQMAPKGGVVFDNLDGSKGYKPWAFYGQSKMANLLFAKELSRRFKPGARTAYAVHPGVIRTNLSRNMGGLTRAAFNTLGGLFTKSIPEGAASEVFCAVNPRALALDGQFVADSNAAKCRAEGDDAALARRLWEVSEAIVARLPS